MHSGDVFTSQIRDDIGKMEISFANKTGVATEERAHQDTREQIRPNKCEETQETQKTQRSGRTGAEGDCE